MDGLNSLLSENIGELASLKVLVAHGVSRWAAVVEAGGYAWRWSRESSPLGDPPTETFCFSSSVVPAEA